MPQVATATAGGVENHKRARAFGRPVDPRLRRRFEGRRRGDKRAERSPTRLGSSRRRRSPYRGARARTGRPAAEGGLARGSSGFVLPWRIRTRQAIWPPHRPPTPRAFRKTPAPGRARRAKPHRPRERRRTLIVALRRSRARRRRLPRKSAAFSIIRNHPPPSRPSFPRRRRHPPSKGPNLHLPRKPPRTRSVALRRSRAKRRR